MKKIKSVSLSILFISMFFNVGYSSHSQYDSLKIKISQMLVFGIQWNRFSQPHNEKQFNPKNELIEFTKKDWKELTKETFDIIFKDSAVKRAKFEGIKRNIFSAS